MTRFSYFLKEFPEPVIFLPLNNEYGTRDLSKSYLSPVAEGISLDNGPDGRPEGSYKFPGNVHGYIEIPQNEKTSVKFNMSFFTWIYNKGTYGPVLNYETDTEEWGVHVFIHVGNDKTSKFYVRAMPRSVRKNGSLIETDIPKNVWVFAGFTYNYDHRKLKVYINGELKREIAMTERAQLKTTFKIRIGGTRKVHNGNDGFTGSLSCFQMYDTTLTEEQIQTIQRYCHENDPFKTCFNYDLLYGNDRLLMGRNYGYPVPDDREKISRIRWYQFDGLRIASSCPTTSRSCGGTHNSGWLRGRYPSLEEGIKKMELCYRQDADCCSSKVNVHVKQCYGYLLFKFDDFPIGGRFCTEPDPTELHDVMYISTNGICLSGHVFYTADDLPDASKCVAYCLNAGTKCKSVNFVMETRVLQCQLNDATKADGHLRYNSNCSYYEMI